MRTKLKLADLDWLVEMTSEMHRTLLQLLLIEDDKIRSLAVKEYTSINQEFIDRVLEPERLKALEELKEFEKIEQMETE
jgi:hypothetical protein